MEIECLTSTNPTRRFSNNPQFLPSNLYELCSNCIKRQRSRLKFGLRHADGRVEEYQRNIKSADEDEDEGYHSHISDDFHKPHRT